MTAAKNNALLFMLVSVGISIALVMAPFMVAAPDPTNGIRFNDRVEVVEGFFEGLTGTAVDIGASGSVQIKFDGGYKYEHIESRNLKLLEEEE